MCSRQLPTQELTERYDPAKPVCDNQADFNEALRKAIRNMNDKDMKKARPWMYVYLVLWLIFTVWGLMLAMKVPAGSERTQHVLFALVFGPAYVIASYLGAMSSESGGKMGFSGGCR